jgi:cation diffusion facilitator CzcD-associated flavoprotein CzcO
VGPAPPPGPPGRRSRLSTQSVDALIIGAGQAGLSTAYWLKRYGMTPGRDLVVLDADEAPGGAWAHRWASLRLSKTHRVNDLPGLAMSRADPDRPSSEVVSEYFADYEHAFDLDVRRPVRARAVTVAADDRLQVSTSGGDWSARAVVNATGTWTHPFVPHYPGQESFAGRQLHTAGFRAAAEFAGQRVLVVGAGASAVQLLAEISEVAAATIWVARREPIWRTGEFSEELGRDIIARVDAHTRAGGAPTSIVSNTGLFLSPLVQGAYDRGVFQWHPMFARISAGGVQWADGTSALVDVILWATGFRPALDHLAPLHLRTPEGGIRVVAGQAMDLPQLFLAGYGPGASTIGANRGGRVIARQVVDLLQAPTR